MKEKQIEEKAKEIANILTKAAYMACEDIPFAPLDFNSPCPVNIECHKCKEARMLIAKGYAKQIEGEWDFHKDGNGTCNQCGTTQKNVWDMDNYQLYCGHCGAKMRGALKMLDQ